MSDRLIFVYNADAGIVAGIIDSIHKTISPQTYACSLCAITYGRITMDRQWKAWLQAQPYRTMFYHRPDFRAAYPHVATDLPAILIERGNVVTTVLCPADIAAAGSVDALIAALEAKLA